MKPAVDVAIDVLNRALQSDPVAINRLFACHVAVNNALRDDPTIQVGNLPDCDGPQLRPLGLINGLFGVAGDAYGFICAEYDDAGQITEFRRLRD